MFKPILNRIALIARRSIREVQIPALTQPIAFTRIPRHNSSILAVLQHTLHRSFNELLRILSLHRFGEHRRLLLPIHNHIILQQRQRIEVILLELLLGLHLNRLVELLSVLVEILHDIEVVLLQRPFDAAFACWLELFQELEWPVVVLLANIDLESS